MPSTSALLTFIAALFVLEITPGPDMMLVLARGVGQGRRVALMTVFGMIFVAGVVQVGLLVLGAASRLSFGSSADAMGRCGFHALPRLSHDRGQSFIGPGECCCARLRLGGHPRRVHQQSDQSQVLAVHVCLFAAFRRSGRRADLVAAVDFGDHPEICGRFVSWGRGAGFGHGRPMVAALAAIAGVAEAVHGRHSRRPRASASGFRRPFRQAITAPSTTLLNYRILDAY